MTQIRVHRVKCDGCEKEVPVEKASMWFHVEQMVTSEEEYAYLLAKAQSTGTSGVLSGDFCTLSCLHSWALNAGTLKAMEDMPPYEGDEDE